MTSMQISDLDICDLHDKVALITGGSSGIGEATVKLLLSKGTKVHILDVVEPETNINGLHSSKDLFFRKCDVSSWTEISSAFQEIGHVDLVFANAGLPEPPGFFDEEIRDEPQQAVLSEPSNRVLDVNLKGAFYTVKLAWHHMKRQGTGGSIVITASATAYFPWQSLAAYCSIKIALVGLVRCLRSLTIRDNITINAVAPGATITKSLPMELAQPIIEAGLPVSSAHTVALALVYSATAMEDRRVEAYGLDLEENNEKSGRWNGRVILTTGDRFTEVEQRYSACKPEWLGTDNTESYHKQQAASDFRPRETIEK